VTITQVLYALTVEQHLNFSAASRALFVSQPALSLQIKALESELGCKLFERSTHGVTLTASGRAFCEAARPLAAAWAEFKSRISGATAARVLRIGLGARVYSNRLFRKIVAFLDNHPEIEVSFVTEAGHDFLSDLREGTLDLALDRLPPPSLLDDAEQFASWTLIEEPQCILLPRSDPRARKNEFRFSELEDYAIITSLENTIEDRTLRYLCRKHGFALSRLYRSDSMKTNMDLLRSGKGVIIGPKSFAGYFGVAAVPLSPSTTASLDFICLKKNANLPKVSTLRRYLQKLCAGRCPQKGSRRPQNRQSA